MANYYCKYCGASNTSIKSLTGGQCKRNPTVKKYHVPYEGGNKPKYYCKYCGDSNSSIEFLTGGSKCLKNPESEYHIPTNID